MQAMTARVTSTNPGRLINRLGRHFSHKIEAQWTDTEGYLTFSIGECRLAVDEHELILACHSDTPEQLQELGEVVASHLIRFAGDEVAGVHWQTATD